MHCLFAFHFVSHCFDMVSHCWSLRFDLAPLLVLKVGQDVLGPLGTKHVVLRQGEVIGVFWADHLVGRLVLRLLG